MENRNTEQDWRPSGRPPHPAPPLFFRLNDTRLSFTHFCHFVAQTHPIVEIAKWHFCQARLSGAEEEYFHERALDLEFCYSYYERHSFDEQNFQVRFILNLDTLKRSV